MFKSFLWQITLETSIWCIMKDSWTFGHASQVGIKTLIWKLGFKDKFIFITLNWMHNQLLIRTIKCLYQNERNYMLPSGIRLSRKQKLNVIAKEWKHAYTSSGSVQVKSKHSQMHLHSWNHMMFHTFRAIFGG
jgi:hypothetical protein